MSRSPTSGRRTMLRLLGWALGTVSLSVVLPARPAAKAFGCLPGSLSLLPLRHELLRQAKRRMEAHPCNRSSHEVAQAYLRSPGHPPARIRFEYHVRRDFVAGRVTVVDGWLVSETELALLESVKRSQ